MLKKINFIFSSFIPQKIYWHLAGLVHPWESVIEEVDNPRDLYKQGQKIVVLLNKLRLINKETRCLDIGCGVGRVEYSLAKHIKKCTGIDIAASMIKLAKEHVKAKNVSFLTTNGKNLEVLKNEKFDLIFSLLVFQHIPRKVFYQYLKDAEKVLEKKGKIFFQISIFQDQKPSEPPKNHPWALRYYSLEELKNTLKKSGFDKIIFYNTQGEKLGVKDNQVYVLATRAR